MDPKELLEMLRPKLTDIAKNDASRQTKIRYGKAAERILEAGGLSAYRPTTKSSWYFARAALKYYLYAHAALAYKHKDFGKTEDLMRRAEIELQVPPPALRPTGRSSTKHRLQGLPVDWRAQIFASLPAAHRLPYAVQALAGARTAELAKGVKVHLCEGGIEITIAGAKLHKQNGQPLRQVVIRNRPDDPAFTALLDASQKAAPEPLSVAITTHIETYRKAIRNAGLRRFDRGRGTSKYITPYMVRHQFASDLKAAEMEPVLVAEALGHRSSRTQELYGYKGLGQGQKGQDVEARASKPVRTYPKRTPDPQ